MARIIFLGTPEFAVPTLGELIAAGHDIVAAYSQPPRPAGRGMAVRRSPVHVFCDEAAIPVATPASLKSATEKTAFAALTADLAVVVAYGLILPPAILAAPRHGCYNVHASLLPRWRGAAPIQRAIMAGDSETGVMVMRMEAGLDTGPVCRAERIGIPPDAVAGDIHDALAVAGARAMAEAIPDILAGRIVCQPQPAAGVTYAEKIRPEEARIDWRRPAGEIHNSVRAFSPFPGAWFETLLSGRSERIKVLRSVPVAMSTRTGNGRIEPGQIVDDQLTVACGNGALRLTRVQRAGKRAMTGLEFLRGFPLGRGTHFS